MNKRDKLFATPLEKIVDFEFDERVVGVFPDMINRSVPGYGTIIKMIGVMAKKVALPGTHLYDLGCSLGAASLAMQGQLTSKDNRIIAVDNSQAMIDSFRKLLPKDNNAVPIECHRADIRRFPIHNAVVTVLNFTLQFIPLEDRPALLHRIAEGTIPGGILVLSEKLSFNDLGEDHFQMESHHCFKGANGYSHLEISQKRSALEKVLIPESFETHRKRLLEAGFKQVYLWFQCFNFCSMVALK